MAEAAEPHTVKTVLAQTVQLAQHATALSSHAKPATDAQIADATGPHRPVMVPVSHATTQTTAQHATRAQPLVTANAVRLATAIHARSVMVSVVHSATALSVMANAVHSVTVTHARSVMVSVVHSAIATRVQPLVTANAVRLATVTAVRAQLLVTVNAVNGLHVTRSATTVAHAMVLAPKSAQAAVHSATAQVLRHVASMVHAILRVMASALTAYSATSHATALSTTLVSAPQTRRLSSKTRFLSV
jgi:hypothetical protein